jgi:hypothetical protein
MSDPTDDLLARVEALVNYLRRILHAPHDAEAIETLVDLWRAERERADTAEQWLGDSQATARMLQREVNRLRARLDALDRGARVMEHRGWDTADVNELHEAIRRVLFTDDQTTAQGDT